ncbi:dipeptide ABC transporter ATP-binding protein [Nocardia stercoris]|uniref:ABC transporter ATP-binding protein n=1 Tax=Nocardia stercoris TaxID=2483361 RepID=A0A3M2KX35_9NOCA|nr:ABC transporter ATP-binding protein [Nocardia stercoris]RMI28065.1 ABC transporter ATP-binding protein [Nocardia stercoris]
MSTATTDTERFSVAADTPGSEQVAAVTDLRVTFRRDRRDVHALRGVTLTVRRGEILGLVGESGSGKSVLGTALLGLLPAATATGTVRVTGTDMLGGDPAALRRVRRLDLGAVFQDPMTSLNPTMRIGAQVTEAAGSSAEAERLLAAVGIPDPARRMRSFPHQLSGGLRQRVMIAMAIAGDPELIVADEPTTALDVTVQAQVLALLRGICDTLGCGILLITHDLGVAGQIADRIAVLYAGRIAEIGPAAAVLTDPAHPYTVGLLRSRLTLDTPRGEPLPALAGAVPSPVTPLPGCAFAPRCERAVDTCAVILPDPLPTTANRTSACPVPPPPAASAAAAASDRPTDPARTTSSVPQTPADPTRPRPTSDPSAPEPAAPLDIPPAAKLHDVTKVFTGGALRGRQPLHALRRVSLTVAPGESLAIVGESGCGKSTLLRIIAGLERESGGTVSVAGRPQLVFQDAGASLTPWMSVGELISERLRGTGASRTERRAAVLESLRRVGLPPEVARARPARLSGGQRQRVSLARATVVPPSILLCDEPTSALDVSLAASVLNLIAELRAELGMSVVFVTHDLAVARVVADRIAVMYLGRIVEIGPADQVVAAPAHPYTAALIASVPELGKEPAPTAGEPASPLDPPTGCAFHPRCPIAIAACADPLLDVRTEGRPGSTHQVACIQRKAS